MSAIAAMTGQMRCTMTTILSGSNALRLPSSKTAQASTGALLRPPALSLTPRSGRPQPAMQGAVRLRLLKLLAQRYRVDAPRGADDDDLGAWRPLTPVIL